MAAILLSKKNMGLGTKSSNDLSEAGYNDGLGNRKVVWLKSRGWFTFGVDKKCLRGLRGRQRQLMIDAIVKKIDESAIKVSDHLAKIGFARQHSLVVISDLSGEETESSSFGAAALAFSHRIEIDRDNFLGDADGYLAHEWAHRWMKHASKATKESFIKSYKRLVVDPLETVLASMDDHQRVKFILSSTLRKAWLKAAKSIPDVSVLVADWAGRRGLSVRLITELVDFEVAPDEAHHNILSQQLISAKTIELKAGGRARIQYLAHGVWQVEGHGKVHFDDLLRLAEPKTIPVSVLEAIRDCQSWPVVPDEDVFVTFLYKGLLEPFLKAIGSDDYYSAVFAEFSSLCLDTESFYCTSAYINEIRSGLSKLLKTSVATLFLKANINKLGDDLALPASEKSRGLLHTGLGMPTDYAMSDADELWAEGVRYFFSPKTSKALRRAITNTISGLTEARKTLLSLILNTLREND